MEFINTYAVDVFTLDGLFVGNWDSKMKAARALNVKNTGNISSCLLGNRNHANGYIWKYHPTEVPILEGEIWKPAKGFETLYAVSNFGRVASLQFHGKKTFSIMAEINGKLNYKFVKLRDWYNGYVRTYPVHRLVAETFLPNPENKPQVDHIDTNPANNRLDNLRWATNLKNQRNPLTLKRISTCITNLNKQGVGPKASAEKRKVKVKVIKDGKEFIYDSYSSASIAEGHSIGTIWRWCNNNRHGWSIIA